MRNEIAAKCGIDATALVGKDDVVALTNEFTGGRGLDTAVMAFGGDANKAYESILESLKCSPDGHRMGRIVVVGGAKFNVAWMSANTDVRIAARTGPGYHDEAWEYGVDYPPVFMRWTTRTNAELCVRLIAEGKLDVDSLTTHTIELQNVDAGISAIIDEPDRILGVIFEMKH
jgi:threonine dehydrogenase-like Zn-dependent dehydrogenase